MRLRWVALLIVAGVLSGWVSYEYGRYEVRFECSVQHRGVRI